MADRKDLDERLARLRRDGLARTQLIRVFTRNFSTAELSALFTLLPDADPAPPCYDVLLEAVGSAWADSKAADEKPPGDDPKP